MKPPPPLRLEPRRSRLALAWLGTSYAATAALLLALPLPIGVVAAGVGGILIAFAFALRQIAGRSAPALLRVGIDRRIGVTTRDGRTRAGDILADSFVGPRLTTIVWRPDGAWLAHTLVIAADSLPADDFRRLRVALRYGRPVRPATSGVDAG